MLEKITCLNQDKKLALCLFLLRLGVGLVFLVWTFDKILVPEHATKVFAGFYGMAISDNIAIGIGVLQLFFVAAFLAGYKKGITYLAALVFHGASTFSAFSKYLAPLDNLLFFAAWPMLAACFTLYMMRDSDVLFCIKEKEKPALDEQTQAAQE